MTRESVKYGTKFQLKWLFGILFLFAGNVVATHIVGGNFEMINKGGSVYDVTLVLFFDNLNGNPQALDTVVTVTTFSKASNKAIDIIALPLTNKDRVTLIKPSSAFCTSSSLSNRLLEYKLTVNFTASKYYDPAGYYLVWQRCCRNGSITNIKSPLMTGNTFYLEFPAMIYNRSSKLNSSPVFNTIKADFACTNRFYSQDFGATDPDGDRLEYKLVTPYGSPPQTMLSNIPAPYGFVQWNPGYYDERPIDPVGNINLSSDGVLSLVPKKAGLFVFTVECTEYRNGIKIGLVRRDYQLLVLNCPAHYPPDAAVVYSRNRIIRDSVQFDTVIIRNYSPVQIPVMVTDTNLTDNLNISLVPVNYTAANFTVSPAKITTKKGDTLYLTVTSPSCIPDPRKDYRLKLLITDQGCPFPNIITRTLVFKYLLPPTGPPNLVSDLDKPEIDLYPNQFRSFNLTATLADTNKLTLSLDTIGLPVNLLGLDFSDTSGYHLLQKPIHLNVSCEGVRALYGQNLNLNFRAITNYTCHSETDTKAYSVALKLHDNNTSFDPKTIVTAFSPNNDKLNDNFDLSYLPIDNCLDEFQSVEVFNRWGKQVYQSTDRNFSWDGSNLPGGVYFYIVHYERGQYKNFIGLYR